MTETTPTGRPMTVREIEQAQYEREVDRAAQERIDAELARQQAEPVVHPADCPRCAALRSHDYGTRAGAPDQHATGCQNERQTGVTDGIRWERVRVSELKDGDRIVSPDGSVSLVSTVDVAPVEGMELLPGYRWVNGMMRRASSSYNRVTGVAPDPADHFTPAERERIEATAKITAAYRYVLAPTLAPGAALNAMCELFSAPEPTGAMRAAIIARITGE